MNFVELPFEATKQKGSMTHPLTWRRSFVIYQRSMTMQPTIDEMKAILECDEVRNKISSLQTTRNT
jgi:hypothetical protein